MDGKHILQRSTRKLLEVMDMFIIKTEGMVYGYILVSNRSNCTLNMCNLFCVSFTSIKL